MGEFYFHVEAIMDLIGVGLFERDSGPVESCIISPFDSVWKLWFKKQIVEIYDKLCVLIWQYGVLFEQNSSLFHTEILLLCDSIFKQMYRNKYYRVEVSY
jgi:hypothetical protein